MSEVDASMTPETTPVSALAVEGDVAPSSTPTSLNVEAGKEEGASKLFLCFDAIQTEPQYEKIFLATGGSISSAAARECTNFALTGSETSTNCRLSDKYATSVRIQVSPDQIQARGEDDDPTTVRLSNRFKLLATTTRKGAAINGTIVSTIAGQSGAYLSSLLRSGTSSASFGLKYGNWGAHSAVINVSNFKLVDDSGKNFNVHFQKDETHDVALKNGEKILEIWAQGAFRMRKDGFQYKPSPHLTKSVAKVPVGINDSGYAPLHDFGPSNRCAYSYSTINSFFEQGINADLDFVQDDVAAFLEDTKSKGLVAAEKGGRCVSSAVSLMANAMIPYRADGRTAIVPTGSQSISTEFWNFEKNKSKLFGDDCDSSAGFAVGILEAAIHAPKEVREAYPFINAVHNVLVPHYVVGLSVLGASSAEASSGGNASEHSGVAGHAVTLMISAPDFLAAMEAGAKQTLGGKPVVEEEARLKITNARFESLYSADAIDGVPDEEREMFASWAEAKKHMGAGNVRVESFGCEGTTPASSILYRPGEAGRASRVNMQNDKKAFKKIGPTIGRSVKILHSADEEGTHNFYRDFVELTLSRDHPLWASPSVRSVGAAASQFVFSRYKDDVLNMDAHDHSVIEAGASPKEVAMRQFALVPLVVADAKTAETLDYASVYAEKDAMPPNASMSEKLSAFQTRQMSASLGHLEKLNETLRMRLQDQDGVDAASEDTTGVNQTVAHVVTLASLVNNPSGIEHLCKRIEANAVSGVVDSVPLNGLLVDDKGNDAGRFVIVNSVVRV